jgi:ABC-2 type transport system permease protein
MSSTVRAHLPGATWRSFRTAAWLGWQVESNWAEPWLFALYAVVKPLALVSILVVMYIANRGTDFGAPAFTFLYLGNAFYIYVGAVMSGMGWTVVQDREHYRMLKVMYAAPIDVRVYLLGRGLARFAVATISVLLTLVAGVLVLDLPIVLTAVDWPLFAVTLATGLILLAFMGLVMAGIMLLSGYEAWAIGELLAGALYLFSGAIFPIDVLPEVLRPLGVIMPVTYWLELLRRALVGPGAHAFPAIASWSDERVLLVLVAATIAMGLIAMATFHLCEARARDRGLFDRSSNY